jgi:signal transduction histidine kinase
MSLSELMVESPDRWRYLDLALALADGPPPGTQELAALLLRGLGRPRRPEDTLAALIEMGEFTAAEQLRVVLLDLAAPGLDPGDDFRIADVVDGMAGARDAARRRVRAQWESLDERAQRVRLPPVPSDAVLAAADRSARVVAQLVAEREAVVAQAEDHRRVELARALAEAAVPGDPLPWVADAEQALAAGEFELAEEILRAGPDQLLDGDGPLAVRAAPSEWPWPDRLFDEVLDRYAGVSYATAEDNRYLPDPADKAAAGLITALIALREGPDERKAENFAAALAQVVGCAIHYDRDVSGPEFPFRLSWPADDPLVRLFPTIRHGLSMAVTTVSGETRPLPPCTVRFHPGPAPRTAAREPILAAPELLLLLARHSRGVPAAKVRRTNLLRAALRRIPARELLTNGVALAGSTAPRTSLAWAFNLIGLVPEALLLDAVLQEVGEHPMALRTVLVALWGAAAADGTVRLDDLRRLIPQLLPQLRQDVLASLREGTTLWATLWLVIECFRTGDVFHADDVYQELSALTGPRGRERLVDPQSVADALSALAKLKMLRETAGGFRLPPDALTNALLSDPLDLEQLAQAMERHAEILDQEAAAAIGPLVARAIGHRVDNEVLGIGRALDRTLELSVDHKELRAELDRIKTRVAALGGGAYTRLYFEALTRRRHVNLCALVTRAVAYAVEAVPVGTAVFAETGPTDYFVQIVPVLLENCLLNLIENAATALQSGPPPWPRPIIRVLVRAPEAGHPHPMTGGEPPVVVEVRDNGPGFSTGQLHRLRAEIGLDEDIRRVLSDNSDRGRGLPLTAALVRYFGGELEVGDEDDQTAGGVIRIWLPKCADQDS